MLIALDRHKLRFSFLVGLFFALPFLTTAQTVFWTEGFGTGCNQNQLPLNFVSSNGAWNVTATGNNDLVSPNSWFISAAEAGNVAGGCGDGCIATPALTNNSLHISRTQVPTLQDSAATYRTGIGSETNLRVESPVINCTGQEQITVEFDYFEAGDGSLDDATFWYSANGGLVWTFVDSLPKTPTTCGPNVGTWVHYQVALPQLADNNPQVHIGFNWTNNTDGIGPPVSFAVDSIVLIDNDTLQANFQASSTVFCEGTSTSFFDLSNGDSITNWDWVFTGGTPMTSTAQNPPNVNYTTPGSYDVQLTVTDSSGLQQTLILPNYITVLSCPPPTADFLSLDTSICIGQCIDFQDQSVPVGGLISWEWNLDPNNTGNVIPNSSIMQNPTNVCFNVAGNYDISLIVTDTLGQKDTITKTAYIEVDTCAPPTAIFAATDSIVCETQAITFTSLSLGNPTTYTWSFPGGTPNISNSANPTIVYNTQGTYPVTLIVTNFSGQDDTIRGNFVTVLACPPPTASFTSVSTTLCEGDKATFINTSNFATMFSWSFPGGNPSFDTIANPTGICYDSAGLYDVTLIVSNINGTDTFTFTEFIEVIECSEPTAEWTVEDDSICIGSCIEFFGPTVGVDSIFWEFEGADSVYQIINQDFSPIVCYSDTGSFSVKLTVKNDFGGDVLFIDDHIKVGDFPTLSVSPDDSIIIGSSTQMIAFGTGTQYFWQPIDLLDCFACPNPNATPTQTTMFVVTNTSELGCSVQDSVEIFVDQQYFAGVPNAFTPNGDDNNDILQVLGNGIGAVEFFVYNRYGQKIFESFNPREGWDGTAKGKEEQPGIYAYFVRVTFDNGVIQELQGNVTLIR